MKRLCLILIATMIGLTMTACGKPDVDVSIFVMPNHVLHDEIVENLQDQLHKKIGDTVTIGVQGSPIYDKVKLMVELMAGLHHIFIMPQHEFEHYVHSQIFVPLEDRFDPDDYPEGYLEIIMNPPLDEQDDEGEEIKETHLFGIPVHQTNMMREAGYDGDDALFAVILVGSPSVEKAKMVLEAIANED